MKHCTLFRINPIVAAITLSSMSASNIGAQPFKLVSCNMTASAILGAAGPATPLVYTSGNCQTQRWGPPPEHDITLPHHQKLGYQPSLSFYIERDAATGNFQAVNANHARFNRVWMDQDNAKQGKDAVSALVKMAAKRLYKSFHERSSGAKRFLPDEEGSIAAPNFSKFDTDYKVHVRGDSLSLGVALAF
ncbi:hypothetical protein [Zhongshania sp.]|uniref:hypothetical protein n=1 Tax=Zhongshania sp. TaxID=1971902 RepID=UPI0035631A3D